MRAALAVALVLSTLSPLWAGRAPGRESLADAVARLGYAPVGFAFGALCGEEPLGHEHEPFCALCALVAPPGDGVSPLAPPPPLQAVFGLEPWFRAQPHALRHALARAPPDLPGRDA